MAFVSAGKLGNTGSRAAVQCGYHRRQGALSLARRNLGSEEQQTDRSSKVESSWEYDDEEFEVGTWPEDFEDEAEDSELEGGVHDQIHSGVRLPIVAVIGRPNVGKSMLVNRLAETHRGGSIVHDAVGITRDRTYKRAHWGDKDFLVVDTGGLVFRDEPGMVFIREIREQALIALQEAAAVIFVTDGQLGLNPLDDQIASFLRKECKVPIVLAVNKCESAQGEILAAEFWSLGLGQPYAVSAIHGSGTGELLEDLCLDLPKVVDPVDDAAVNIAIVGRPNVGKSTLLNKLVKADRSIVSEMPGTTRDAVDEMIENEGKVYRLIDTAGIRRKRGIQYGTEFFMINRAFNAIRRSDVSLLVVDALEAIADQDGKIAERIVDEGRACIIVCNKWDAVEDKDNKSWQNMNDYVRESLPMLPWAPIIIASAKTGQRTKDIFEMVNATVAQHRRRVSTAVLNEVLHDAVAWHKPPATKQGKQGKIYYCTQVSVRPPTIAMFVNDPSLFRDNYRRYLEGQFRKSLGFPGTPVRIVWRGKSRAPTI